MGSLHCYIQGCTAVQIAPEIVKGANSLTIFQRTPNWVIPRQDTPVASFWRGVYRYIPPIRWRLRAAMMDFRESFYDAVINGQHPLAEELRSQSKEMVETQLADRPELGQANPQI